MACGQYPLTYGNRKAEGRREADHKHQPPVHPRSWLDVPSQAPGTRPPSPGPRAAASGPACAQRLRLGAGRLGALKELEELTTSPSVRDSLSLPVSGKADPQLPTQFIMKTDSQQKTARAENTGTDRGPKIARCAAVARGVLWEGGNEVLGRPELCRKKKSGSNCWETMTQLGS